MDQPIQFADIDPEPALDSNAATRRLDPALIQPSPWANRHEASFVTDEFAGFKREIAQSLGNVHPIKVRPLKDATQGAAQFELVYGHRRHRACLELKLPVLALIEATTDVELFEQMERENRGHSNLSAWEKGMMYRKAQETKLYVSMRQMVDRLGLTLSVVSKSVQLTKLHPSVIAAFPSPTLIQFRWITLLTQAAKADSKGLRERAHALVKEPRKPLKAAEVFAFLVNEPETPKTAPTARQAPGPSPQNDGLNPQSVTDFTVFHRETLPTIHAFSTAPRVAMKSGQPAATLSIDDQGSAVMRFAPGALTPDQYAELMQLMETFLNKG
jgi:ParB family transcriptional regulator, chromosome partitioning protein